MPPPLVLAELLETVLEVTVAVPELKMPPPSPEATLLWILLVFCTLSVPLFQTPAPVGAELPLIVVLSIVIVPELANAATRGRSIGEKWCNW